MLLLSRVWCLALACLLLGSLPVLPAEVQAQAEQTQAQTVRPQTIVVFGDSQAEGLAAALRRQSHRYPGVKIENRTKPGTAIGQPDKYDWVAVLQDYTRDPGVKIAVLMFGGNDRLPMRPASAPAIPFRSDAWETIYRDRLKAMLDSLQQNDLSVLWVGQPICREQRYSNDMEYLNTLYRAATDRDGVRFLDIWAATADAHGQYAAYGPTLQGATARLRLDDGIHFTPAGYDRLAARVLGAIADPAAP